MVRILILLPRPVSTAGVRQGPEKRYLRVLSWGRLVVRAGSRKCGHAKRALEEIMAHAEYADTIRGPIK